MFRHALTREVAYDGMLQARRRELHGRAGAALEHFHANRFEHCELLAYHYSHSAEPQHAIPYLAAAGDRAKDRYANEEAVTTYRRAIELIEELDGSHRADPYGAICESLGVVLHRLSRFDAAIGACRKGLAVARDAGQRARLRALWCDAEEGAHRYLEGLAQCDLAEQELGPASDPPELPWLSAWLAVQHARMSVLYWLNDTQAHARLVEQVRPYVEAHGSAEQRASFLISMMGCPAAPGPVPYRRRDRRGRPGRLRRSAGSRALALLVGRVRIGVRAPLARRPGRSHSGAAGKPRRSGAARRRGSAIACAYLPHGGRAEAG